MALVEQRLATLNYAQRNISKEIRVKESRNHKKNVIANANVIADDKYFFHCRFEKIIVIKKLL